MISLAQLEKRFLSIVPKNGFSVVKSIIFPDDLEQAIPAGAARADIAMFTVLLIQAYGGWPFYPKLLRRQILVALTHIYDSIADTITIRELYEKLKPIIAMMPDRHIMMAVDNNPALNRSVAINVGENLVKSRNITAPYLIEKQGRIGIIALSRFFAPDDAEHLESIRQQVLDIMSDTDAIIIDLRDNGGGSPHIATMLAAALSGCDSLPHSRRMFCRGTELARKLHSYLDAGSYLQTVSIDKDPFMFTDNTKFKMPKDYKWAYSGDIYVLTNNRSASSSERVVTYMKYNPKTKVVGTHTSGCSQYAYYISIALANSGIVVRIPLVYKEVPHVPAKGFEMHGFKPDIECAPGTDAMTAAMQNFTSTHMTTVNNKENNK